MGAVAVAVDRETGPDRLARVLKNTDCRAVLVGQECLDKKKGHLKAAVPLVLSLENFKLIHHPVSKERYFDRVKQILSACSEKVNDGHGLQEDPSFVRRQLNTIVARLCAGVSRADEEVTVPPETRKENLKKVVRKKLTDSYPDLNNMESRLEDSPFPVNRLHNLLRSPAGKPERR